MEKHGVCPDEGNEKDFEKKGADKCPGQCGEDVVSQLAEQVARPSPKGPSKDQGKKA